MAWWSKHYNQGDLIAIFGSPDQTLRVGMINDVPVVMYQLVVSPFSYLCISTDFLKYYFLDRVFDVDFNEADLQFFANDAQLTQMFDQEKIVGAYLYYWTDGTYTESPKVLGAYDTEFEYGVDTVPSIRPYTRWKPGLLFNDLRPVRNDLVVAVDAVEGLVSRENLVYKMEIKKPIFPGSATLEVLEVIEGTEAPPRIENGITYMDGWQPEIGWYLDGCLEWAMPETESSAIMTQPRAVMPFYVTTWAEQDNEEIVGSRSSLMTLWGIKAKISEEDFANWNSRVFSKYIGENGKWLTWQPNNMEVDDKTPLFLSFLVNRKPTPAKIAVMVQIFDENGEYHFFQHSEVTGLAENALLNVPMGFRQLNLHLIGTDSPLSPGGGIMPEDIDHWTVWLVDETYGRISRKRNFVMDRSRRRNLRYVMFINSLAGVDAVRLTGVTKESMTMNAQMQAKGLGAAYKTSTEEYFVRNKTGEMVVELNTGKMTKTWQAYYEELAWAERVIMKTNAGMVALTADKSSFVVPGVDSFIDSRSFIFKKSKAVVGFSRMPLAVEDAGDRPTAWLAAQPYCLSDTGTGFRTGMMAYNSLKLHYIDVSPAEPVRGVASKENVSGASDYVPPINSATCVAGSAAFENESLSMESTYSKDNCGSGYKGTTWTIEVDAGEFGGENQEAANARALEEYHRRNTQANVNLPGNGSCVLLQAGLDAEYRNYSVGIENSPDDIFELAVGAARVDVHINDPQQFLPIGIVANYLAIEHNGYLKSDWTGNVVLQLEHLAGVRLYVNNVLVINNWTGSGISECIIPMVVGNYYQVKVQYGYKNTGGAKYVLNWRISGGSTLLVPAYACFR
jgi:hypothetical protein